MRDLVARGIDTIAGPTVQEGSVEGEAVAGRVVVVFDTSPQADVDVSKVVERTPLHCRRLDELLGRHEDVVVQHGDGASPIVDNRSCGYGLI